MMMTRIKGICEGGQPFAPLLLGDHVADEEGEEAEFVGYTSTGWSGYFRYGHRREPYVLPLAGLLRIAPEFEL
jgi:hypothetical protein